MRLLVIAGLLVALAGCEKKTDSPAGQQAEGGESASARTPSKSGEPAAKRPEVEADSAVELRVLGMT